MNRYAFWTLVVLIALAVFVGALFVVQNGARETQLSLNLGFMAWELAQPVSLPALMGICLGTGWLAGLATWGVISARSAGRRSQARASLEDDDGWR